MLLAACPALCATTVPSQIYLGMPQPTANKEFQLTVLVEKSGDAAAAATGSVTVSFGDGGAPATMPLVNSVAAFAHTYAAAGGFTVSATYTGDSTTATGNASQGGVVLATAAPAVVLHTFGDSITHGDLSSEGYTSYIASAEGWQVSDSSVSGANSADICSQTYNSSVVGGPISAQPTYSTLLAGENDLVQTDFDTGGLAQYTSTMLACSAWLAIPSSTASGAVPKRTAQDPANTTSGAWTASDLYAAIGRRSIVAGSTLTGSFSGNALYVGLTATTSTDYELSISVDGTAAATYSPRLVYAGAQHAYGAAGFRLAVSGVTGSRHIVTFTCVEPGSSGCYVDWFGGNGAAAAGAGPYLWLGTPMYDLQGGYGPTPFQNMADAVRGIQQQLAADGSSVYLANTFNTLVGQTQPQCYADDRHPNACGDRILAATFEQAMDALLPYAAAIRLSTAGLHNFGYVADGLSTNYGVQVTNNTTANYPIAVSLTGSPEFSQYNNCPASLAAGAKCEIIFTFAPEAAEVGWASTTWSLGGTGAVLPQNGGTLEGDAYPSTALTLNTSAHNFGTEAVGTSSTSFGLVIVNPGATPFTGSLAWSGATSQFAVSGNCALPLPAFSNCVANVTFAPTAPGGKAMQLTLLPTAGEKAPASTVVTFSGQGG